MPLIHPIFQNHLRIISMGLALIGVSITSSQAQTRPRVPGIEQRTKVSQSAREFNEIWQYHKAPKERREAIEKFRVHVMEDLVLPTRLRVLLSNLSADNDGKGWKERIDGQPHAALAVLQLMAFQSVDDDLSPKKLKAARKKVALIEGRIAENLEYGYYQYDYDQYLQHVNDPAPSEYNFQPYPISGPKIDEQDKEYRRLQAIFAEVGDTQWEIKAIRWQLGSREYRYVFLSDNRTEKLWARLAQLEDGLAGELNLFIAQSASLGWEGETTGRSIELPKYNDVIPLTAAHCREVVEIMLKMNLPWEAYSYLQHVKQEWDIDSPDLLAQTKESWQKKFADKADNSRPSYVASVLVKPKMTLEEFVEEMKTRRNLPK